MEERMASAEHSNPAFAKPAVWPLFAALGLLYALVAVSLYASLQENDGLLIYALDDAYIHMAMAKNLAMHGVWGVTRYGFTHSSSSLIWTSMLWLAYLLTGVNSYAPFVLNLAAASGVVFISWARIKKHLTPLETASTLAAVVVLAPLPAMVFVGMEHSLHILVSIAFLFAVTDALEEREGGSFSTALLLAPLLVGTRYEGLFLVFAACCLLFLNKQVKKAVLLGISSLVVITLFGFYSMHEGWYFLPTSLILKGGSSLSNLGVDNFRNAPEVTALLALNIAALLMLLKKDASRERMLIILFLAASVLHMVFASVGWFRRYEAYIVAMGVLVFSLSFRKALSVQKGRAMLAPVLILALLACKPLFERGYKAFVETPRATNNIYSQQYQMGTFLAKYFPGKTVAANDIGAISYLADIRIVDLFGLGTKEVAAARKAKAYTSLFIEELCESGGVDLAVVYDSCMEIGKNAPEGWDGAAKWRISDNVVCGSDTVTFYAMDPKIKQSLRKALEEYSPTLPAGCRYGFRENKL